MAKFLSLLMRFFLIVFCCLASGIIRCPELKAQPRLVAIDSLEKKIFAHYLGWYADSNAQGQEFFRHWTDGYAHTPLIGTYDSRNPSLLTYHLLLAKACGIDGFVLNWYGKDQFENQSLLKLRSTLDMLHSIDSSAFHFSFAVSYDDKADGSLNSNLVYLRDSIINVSPYYLHQDGKPVLFIYNYDGYSEAADYRRAADSVFSSSLFLVWNESQDSVFDPVDACYPWVTASDLDHDNKADWDTVNGLEWGKSYLDDFYSRVKIRPAPGALRFSCGGVWPGFDDRKNTSWGANRWIDRRNGIVYDSTWKMAMSYSDTQPLPWIYIETWNDWNEGSEIEPSVEDTTKYLQNTIGYINQFKQTALVMNDSIFTAAKKIYRAYRLIETGERDSVTFFPKLKNALKYYLDKTFSRAQEIADSIVLAQPEDPTITKLFQDSYFCIKSMRQSNGVYIDALPLTGGYKPGCITANGIGLISLCIADAMYKKTGDALHWEPNAAALADTTILKFKKFKDSSAANAVGLFRHWFDVNTGLIDTIWKIDGGYSTIDNALFAMGLIFCENYFSGNASIVNNAHTLLNAMDFTAAITDDGNKLHLTLDSTGIGKDTTEAFNEYMIVAWLAKNVAASNPGYSKSQTYWNTYYSNPKTASIGRPNYWGYELLSDKNNAFISNFIPQFTYYYCHYYKNNSDYMDYFNNARKSDSLWWTKASPGIPSYEWGLGAGENPGGDYSANAIDNNSSLIVSPHIIAGFIPIYAQGKNDLKSLFSNKPITSVYSLPNDSSKKVLWRYSRSDTTKRCAFVQAVDYSSLLYGLASLPEYLGPNFFDTYNDITPDSTINKVAKDNIPLRFSLEQNFPNPFNPSTVIMYQLSKSSYVTLKVYDVLGREIKTLVAERQVPGSHTATFHADNFPSGVYFYRLKAQGFNETKKLLLLK